MNMVGDERQIYNFLITDRPEKAMWVDRLKTEIARVSLMALNTTAHPSQNAKHLHSG